jgi:hypothetical protein
MGVYLQSSDLFENLAEAWRSLAVKTGGKNLDKDGNDIISGDSLIYLQRKFNNASEDKGEGCQETA